MKQGTRAEINNFATGLITEASPLNIPASAVVDIENFELNRNGTVERRLGFDIGPMGTYDNAGTGTLQSNHATSYVHWKSVGGNPNMDFLVVQAAHRLFLYNGYKWDDVYLRQIIDIGNNFSAFDTWQYAQVDGRLVIAGNSDYIAILKYDVPTNSVQVTYDRLTVRDVWGMCINPTDDASWVETDPRRRANAFEKNLYYNLMNQGWNAMRKNVNDEFVNPIASFKASHFGKMPSMSDSVYTALQMAPVAVGSAPKEILYTTLWDEAWADASEQPKGSFVIDLMNRGNGRKTAMQSLFNSQPGMFPSDGTFFDGWDVYSAMIITGMPPDYTEGGIKNVCEFAGRVFYSGIDGANSKGTGTYYNTRIPSLTNHVFFSRLVKSNADVVRCYQEGDPAGRATSDVVDTDGGFIKLSGAKNIVGMRVMGSSLIIVATNGVWAVSGGSDFGFSATNYKVDKLAEFGAFSNQTIVSAGATLLFWGQEGIFRIGKDKLGDAGLENLSLATIQTYYDKLPELSKKTAKGIYDPYSKKVRWLFKYLGWFDGASRPHELILDLATGAFSIMRISASPGNQYEVVQPMSVFPLPQQTITDDVRDSSICSNLYLLIRADAGGANPVIRFGSYNNKGFRDWGAVDNIGVDSKAFLRTGAQTGGDASVEKQIPYFIAHFYRTEKGVADYQPDHQSSCLVRVAWNWAESNATKEWGNLFQAYRYRKARFVTGPDDDYDTGYSTVVSKSKLRGRGKSFALYMETEPYKDCRLIGWNVTINANSLA